MLLGERDLHYLHIEYSAALCNSSSVASGSPALLCKETQLCLGLLAFVWWARVPTLLAGGKKRVFCLRLLAGKPGRPVGWLRVNNGMGCFSSEEDRGMGGKNCGFNSSMLWKEPCRLGPDAIHPC